MIDHLLVLDLDDTLYAERDYVRSALSFAGRILEERTGQTDEGEAMWAAWRAGEKDPVGKAVADAGLDAAVGADLVRAMRAHRPDIALHPDAARLLDRLRGAAKPFAILTDGRSVTQREKIAALGLGDAAYISISEEQGLPKTAAERFVRLEEAVPARAYTYVGDNPVRDFLVPNARGWHSVLLAERPGMIHPRPTSLTPEQRPAREIADLEQLLDETPA